MVKSLPAVLCFEGAELNIIDRHGRPWLAAADLARALGYARADQVARIYERNIGEFSEAMTLTVNLAVKGFGAGESEKPVRIFSARGCHLVAMFSRTAKAAAFRRWVLDVLEQYETPPAAPLVIDPMPGFGEAELHGAALDLIRECPELLLRDLRLMLSWDFTGRQQVKVVPTDACVLRPAEVAWWITERETFGDDPLKEIARAALLRLRDRGGNRAVHDLLQVVDPEWLLVLKGELVEWLYRSVPEVVSGEQGKEARYV